MKTTVSSQKNTKASTYALEYSNHANANSTQKCEKRSLVMRQSRYLICPPVLSLILTNPTHKKIQYYKLKWRFKNIIILPLGKVATQTLLEGLTKKRNQHYLNFLTHMADTAAPRKLSLAQDSKIPEKMEIDP